jgi:lipid II:glycine glycyltransferase (peptidoglycan interpeptide bridge formation enzyme)
MAKTFRQKARQARRGGLEVAQRTDAEALDIFFRLHLETRRRLGVPTQPKSFIARFEKLFAAGHGCVWVVEDAGEPICAAVFLTQGRTVTYKYSASAGASLSKRPNNLLLLEAVRFYAENGFARIELGRTDIDAEGLCRFKRSLGAEELPLAYTYLSEPAPLGEPSLKEKVMSATIRRGPPVVGRLAGQMLYRHVG